MRWLILGYLVVWALTLGAGLVTESKPLLWLGLIGAPVVLTDFSKK